MKTDTALKALSALSHDSRLAAFRQLVQAGPDGLSVGELRERLDLPPATLTAHLNVLRTAALVHDQREGRVIRVRANYLQMNAPARLPHRELLRRRRRLRARPPACKPQKKGASQVNRFHVHLNVSDLDDSIRFYSQLFASAADRAQGRLRQVDAGGSARQLRDLEHRPCARHRPSRHPGRQRRRTGRARSPPRCGRWHASCRRTRPSAATRARTRCGRKTRKARAGRPSTRSARRPRTTAADVACAHRRQPPAVPARAR